MHLHCIQPILVETGAASSGQSFNVYVEFMSIRIGSAEINSCDGIVASGNDLMGNQLGHGTENHTDNTLGCISASSHSRCVVAAHQRAGSGADVNGTVVAAVGGQRGINDTF